MLAKITSKNQITIPKKIIDHLPCVDHFDVSIKDGSVILKPIKVYDMDLEQIRSKVKNLELSDNCVSESVAWARSKS